MRWGFGPVFQYECVALSRRWLTYALRSVGVLALLIAMLAVAIGDGSVLEGKSAREYAALGESLYSAMIGVQLTLIMLVAPAATAGTICLDRSRGTLEHMLATDLSDPEIVLGKLAARLLPVLGLVACTWPVMAMATLLGGIDPDALSLGFAIILAVGLLGCTLALTLSIWARKPHEVVLACYSLAAIVLLIWPIWTGFSTGLFLPPPPAWTYVINPFYMAFAPYAVPGKLGAWAYVGFFAATLGSSLLLALIAVWRMRPVGRRGLGGSVGHQKRRLAYLGRLMRWLPGPSLDFNPVLWREWHATRPSAWITAIVILLGGSTGIACIVGAATAWSRGLDAINAAGGLGVSSGVFGYLIQIIFGLLMLSAVAAMSLSEERQRGSLDILTATTLSTREIVLGKWLGAFRIVPLLAIGPGLMAFALATAHKAPVTAPAGIPADYYREISWGTRISGACLLIATILAHGSLITSLGLALAIWIKRQGRAIALSVSAYIVIAIVWPFLVHFWTWRSRVGTGISSLSPVMVAGFFADFLTIRRASMGLEVPYWVAFWDLEVFALSLGLLWLATRTFDPCLGRVPERPRTTPYLADFATVYCGITSLGYAFGALVIGSRGWNFQSQNAEILFLISAGMVPGALGLVLLEALTPLCLSPPNPGTATEAGADAILSPAPRQRMRRAWRASLGLILPLAVGIGLLAFAVALADHADPIPDYVLGIPPGGRSLQVSVAAGTEVKAQLPSFRLGIGPRLVTAAILTMTLFVHGAAIASLGLFLGAWVRSPRWAVRLSLALFLLISIVLPILILLLVDVRFGPGLSLISVFVASGTLLTQLFTREPQFPGLLGWSTVWVVVMTLVTLGLYLRSIRMLERREVPKPLIDLPRRPVPDIA